ncbi:hypothetical protein TIFTF001_003577 [Ficus carica]|uniref:F-box/LRR-repeat protein n=1 Tax=Ficus carica TaxID=3494 RepID=A0AA87ZU73_FICCA|nr:hypothetical protein TIFTF001_003577 [Ficus carica]
MTCLIFNFHLYIKGKELISVAQRSPKLKRLVLPAWNQINLEAFKDVVKYWKDLESLTVPFMYRCERILKSFGVHCKNFSELKILSSFPIHFANAIIAHVPNLKVLSLQYTVVYEDAALHLLRNMKREIIACALHLKKFLFCTDFRGPKCNGNSITDHSVIWWHEFEEEHWRQDEVPSLAV